MNLEERIEHIWELYGAGNLSLEQAKIEVKKLVRDVIEYVKPEHWYSDDQFDSGIHYAVEHIEARAKELGA